MTITIYSTKICPFCVRAKALLDQQKLSYNEVLIDKDENMRAEMMNRSGGARSVPQIFVGNHHIGGCDDLYALPVEELHNLVSKS